MVIKDGAAKTTAAIAKNRKGFKTLKPPAKDNTIRLWRIFRGFDSQGELADACGLTRATVSRLESGAMDWRKDQLEALAKALACSPSDLIDTDPNLQADVFKIFRRIPVKKRAAAMKALERLLQ